MEWKSHNIQTGRYLTHIVGPPSTLKIKPAMVTQGDVRGAQPTANMFLATPDR